MQVVYADNQNQYQFTDSSDATTSVTPNLYLMLGDSLTLTVTDTNNGAHPFHIVDQLTSGVGGYDSDNRLLEVGISDQGLKATSGSETVTWTPSQAGTYYYVCQYHPTMAGEVHVIEYTQSYKDDLIAACSKWSDIITTDMSTYGAGVDKFELAVSFKDLGSDTTIASAGVAGILQSGGYGGVPWSGFINVNLRTILSAASITPSPTNHPNNTQLYYVQLHEIGHALGIGTLWNNDTGLFPTRASWIDNSVPSNPQYVGPNSSKAVAMFNHVLQESGSDWDGGTVLTVPLEDDGSAGTSLAHPDEGYDDQGWENKTILTSTGGYHNINYNNLYNDFSAEIMTGYISATRHMPISKLTGGFLEDLGWSINYYNTESIWT